MPRLGVSIDMLHAELTPKGKTTSNVIVAACYSATVRRGSAWDGSVVTSLSAWDIVPRLNNQGSIAYVLRKVPRGV
jgi:hypothetical protein